MTKLSTLLSARWFLTLIGTVALSLIVWFAGPLLAVADWRPLDGELSRLVAILAIASAWAIPNGIAWRRAQRTDAALLDGATATTGPQDGTAAEIAILRERLSECVALLRKTDPAGGRARRYLYQIPWYMMIGPPGSGKSTALEGSGLIRQIVPQRRRGGDRGVGGTRNCNWLFTEQAVLIDTAGRYTTQNSQGDGDAAAWNGFLGLLKRTRPRQPINGTIVAVSLADLMGGSEAERAAHADAIRARLNELHQAFGIRLPTYLLLTKADLIEGFSEFFDDLARSEREQVWGATFFPTDPEDGQEHDPLDRFAQEFDAIVERLSQRVLERLQQEQDTERRARILAFPAQVALLKDRLEQFLTGIFEPSRFDGQPLLRGFYLTSGTQAGSPIDRLTADLSRMLGLDQSVAPLPTGPGRAYFLTALLRDVIFPEAGLVGFDPAVEKRRRRTQLGWLAASLLAAVACLAAWAVNVQENLALLSQADETIARFSDQIEALNKPAGRTPLLQEVLEPLDTIRSLAVEDAPSRVLAGFLLFQGDRIRAGASASYRRSLRTLLLPLLTQRLETRLRQNQMNPAILFDALKTYMMLTGRGPLDRTHLRRRLAAELDALYPDAAMVPVRRGLMTHVDALLSSPLAAMTGREPAVSVLPDEALIEESRRRLSRYPAGERVYGLLKQRVQALNLKEWRIVDAAGSAAARVFARQGDKTLSDGIPGYFTREGFHATVMPALPAAVTEVLEESWVLSDSNDAAKLPGDQGLTAGNLVREALQRYLNEYIEQWDGLLNGLTLVPMRNSTEAATVALELAGAESPLRNLLTAVVAQTRLTSDKTTGDTASDRIAALANAANLPGSDRLKRILDGAAAVVATLPEPGRRVDDHFVRLHRFVEGRGVPEGASMEDLLRQINELYGQLSRIQQGKPAGPVQAGLPPAQRIGIVAAQMPSPATAIASQIAKAGSAASVGSTRAELNAAWTSQVQPFCRQSTEGRYPVYRNGGNDVTLGDFAKLFGPGGLIDGFFNQNLRTYVDMGRQPWQWRRVDGVDLGIPSVVLLQFQRAAAIRDAFFGTGPGVGVSIKFELVPGGLDPQIRQAVLEIDGQPVSFPAIGTRPIPLQWPGAVGQTRLLLNGGSSADLLIDGPWSWFRLLDRAKRSSAGGRERIAVTLPTGNGNVGFELRSGSSVNNPFNLGELAEFRCPGSL